MEGYRFMVVGYDAMAAEDGRGELGYLTVPYPLGFMNMDDIRIVPASAEIQVISEGWDDDASREMMPGLEEFAEGLRGVDEQELRALMRKLSKDSQEAQK